MKKLVFIFMLIAAVSKAQNDSISFFAYTDYNNNCLYEPLMGEEPLNHFAFDFAYKFTTGFVQTNTKTTDSNGMIKFQAVSPLLSTPANTLIVANCMFAGTPQLSSCFTVQDLNYSATYSVGIYSPSGNSAFKFYMVYDFVLGGPGQPNVNFSTPGYKFFCIGKSVILSNELAFNYTGNNFVSTPFSLSFQGGSVDFQAFTMYTNYSSVGCASGNGSGLQFTNPELSVPGIYTVTLTAPGVNAPTYTNTFVLIVDSCESYSGDVYVDCNGNCTKDAGEYNCDEEVISATNSTYSTTVIPDYNGNYTVLSPYSATQYTATITPNTDFALSCSTPSMVIYTSNSASAAFFPNTLTQTAVNAINYFSALEHPYGGSSVPGGNFKFTSYYDVSKPDFCSAVNNAGIYYVKLDQNTQLVSVEPGTINYSSLYTTASGDSIVWSLADLRTQAMNLGGHRFVLNISMKTTATVGLPYSIISGVVSNVTETTMLDNRKVGTWLIGGPFDPNYKEVSPKGTGTQGDIPPATTDLQYTIHFQNVGTAPAINVGVKDLLDSDLDKSSLKIIGSSHPVQTNIDDHGQVTFLFDNILLADSTHDEPNSHGFVSYRIKLKPNPALGTEIRNTAAIYFDYNAPVITNTTLNTIHQDVVSGISEEDARMLSVFPNPANNFLTVNFNRTIAEVRISNVLGETVRTVSANTDHLSLDISDLSPNVYFLEIITPDHLNVTKKIVKQ